MSAVPESERVAFEAIINKQLLQVQQLEQILLQEKEILQQQDPDALVAISNKKTDLLTVINATDASSKESPNYQALLADPGFAETFANIENCLAHCKELNSVNGMIIQQSSLAIERLQNELLENRSRSSMTYDNKGKKNAGLMGKGIKA
ncbi:flagellar export chaperone FlgN [Thalassotalea agariperforans]